MLCSRTQAAALLNIGPTTFDKLRELNTLLRPVHIGAKPLWPLANLVAFVSELIEDDGGDDPWATPP